MDKVQVICAQDKVEKISKITLWVLIGITIVVMALFLLVGYDNKYEENPNFNDPQLTDLLIVWTYILIGAACVATIGAVIYGFVNGSNKSKNEDISARSTTRARMPMISATRASGPLRAMASARV